MASSPSSSKSAAAATAHASTPQLQRQSLRFGVVGIGRIGQRHALNLLRLVPHASLVCVCSPAAAEQEWAQKELAPYGS